jgi:hypothetical protein
MRGGLAQKKAISKKTTDFHVFGWYFVCFREPLLPCFPLKILSCSFLHTCEIPLRFLINLKGKTWSFKIQTTYEEFSEGI